MRIIWRMALVILAAYLLYALSYCVLYPRTVLTQLTSIYTIPGKNPDDIADEQGNITFHTRSGTLVVPARYIWFTVDEERKGPVYLTFDYETLESALGQRENPLRLKVTINAYRARAAEETWAYHDFFALKKKNLLVLVDENLWDVMGPKTYIESAEWKKQTGVKLAYWPLNNDKRDFFTLINERYIRINCADLCSVRGVDLGNGYSADFSLLAKQDIKKLPYIINQTRKLIERFSKEQ
jgi:hypothetical protein